MRAYRKETDRQKLMIKKASLAQSRLLFVVNGLRRLLDDEHFVTLLRAEAMHTLPLGFRPPGEVRIPILNAGGATITHAIYVGTSGAVSLSAVAGSVTAAARIPPITFQVNA